MRISERQYTICEANGFKVTDHGDYAELEGYSPAGEDVILTVWDGGRGFAEEVCRLYEDYDAEDHAAYWIPERGKNGVPNTIEELLDDAEAIGEMLRALVVNLGELEEKN